MGNGLTRLQTRFLGDDAPCAASRRPRGSRLRPRTRRHSGLVTFAPDDIDWADEVRIAVEERAQLQPGRADRPGGELPIRRAGDVETKIFGRLTAWQNWIFFRPNASGPDGALRSFGTGTAGPTSTGSES